MTDANIPHQRDADDAVADGNPPTDAVTDEVRGDAAEDESGDEFPDAPASTHP